MHNYVNISLDEWPAVKVSDIMFFLEENSLICRGFVKAWVERMAEKPAVKSGWQIPA